MKANSSKKPLRVNYLNGDSQLFIFDSKTYVKEAFDKACAVHSIKQTQFFGLSLTIENESVFLDEKEKLSKYTPKNIRQRPRKKNENVGDKPASIPAVTLQVQFFVEHPKLIRDVGSRYYYYLHLKKNLLESAVVVQDEVVFTLAATALYVDFGAFDKSLHIGNYFLLNEYLPKWFIEKWSESYLMTHLPKMHAGLSFSLPYQAQCSFIEQASVIEDISVHFYKLFKAKSDKTPSVVLGISDRGIRLQHLTRLHSNSQPSLSLEFSWNKIGRFLFNGKRFEIYPSDLPSSRKLIYYTGKQARSKCLLRLLRNTHSLHLSLCSVVEQLKKTNVIIDKQKYRETCVDGDLTTNKKEESSEEKVLSICSDHNSKQLNLRKSTASHRSSQTSGIESDERPHPESSVNTIQNEASECNEASSNDAVICVTDEHLMASPSKKLSVTNLVDAVLKEIDKPKLNQPENQLFLSKKMSLQELKDKKQEDEFFSSDYFLTHTIKTQTPRIKQEKVAVKQRPLTADYDKLKSNQRSSKALRRASSGISEILDLLPDVPPLETFCSYPNATNAISLNNSQLLGSSIKTENNDSGAHSSDSKKASPVYNSKPKHSRSDSLDSLFDYNPSKMLIALRQDRSLQDDPKADKSSCNLNDPDFFSNDETKIDVQVSANSNSKSSDQIHCRTEQDNSNSKNSTCQRPSNSTKTKSNEEIKKTSFLSRSEKQKNIPFVFQNNLDFKTQGHVAKTRKERKHSSMIVSQKEMSHLDVDQLGANWACSPRAVALHRRKSQEMYNKHFSNFLIPNKDFGNKTTKAEKLKVVLRPNHSGKPPPRIRSQSYNITSSNVGKRRRNSQVKTNERRPYSAPRRFINVNDAKEIIV